jgi:hypothetical protein
MLVLTFILSSLIVFSVHGMNPHLAAIRGGLTLRKTPNTKGTGEVKAPVYPIIPRKRYTYDFSTDGTQKSGFECEWNTNVMVGSTFSLSIFVASLFYPLGGSEATEFVFLSFYFYIPTHTHSQTLTHSHRYQGRHCHDADRRHQFKLHRRRR